ncbi:hypothetical protein ACFL1N_16965, partial [Thermodesulfobacteriota bacterium]
MKVTNKLLIFTEYFPYGKGSEHAFIQNEIKYLCEKFDKVIVYPAYTLNEKISFKEYEIDNSLSLELRKRNKYLYPLIALKSSYFYKEILLKKITSWNLKRFKRLLYFLARVQIVREWAKRSLAKSEIENKKILAYTFWNNEITLALSSLNKFKVVSRAHGHDLYEEYDGYFGYLPCYKYILQNILKLY